MKQPTEANTTLVKHKISYKRTLKYKKRVKFVMSINNLGILQESSTCPISQKHFPASVGGGADCSTPTNLTGIDIDGFGNSVITHTVYQTLADRCLWTEKGRTVSGNYSYILKMDKYGDVLWKHYSNYTEYIIQNPVIAQNFVFTSLEYKKAYRIVKLDYATGVQLDDRNFAKYTPKLLQDMIKFLQVEADQITQDLYVYLEITSNYFKTLGLNSLSGIGAGMLIKMDLNLKVMWWKMMNTFVKAAEYKPQILKLGANNIWALAFFNTINQIVDVHIIQIDKIQGKPIQDQIYKHNTHLSTAKIQFSIDFQELRWAAIFKDTSNIINILIGQTSDMAITQHFQKTLVSSKRIQCLLMDISNGNILNQQMIFQNFFIDTSAISDESLDTLKYSCINTTANTLTAFTTKAVVQSISTTVRVSMVDVAETDTNLGYFSLDNSAMTLNYTSKPFAFQSCNYPIAQTSTFELIIDQGLTQIEFQATDCRNRNSVLTGIGKFLDGSNLTGISLTPNKTNSLQLNLTNVTQYQLQGSRVVLIQFELEGSKYDVPFRLTTKIPTNLTVDPTAEVIPCEDKIFPFFFGQTTELQMLHVTIDDYSNFLMAGFARNNSYSDGPLQNRGFVQLMSPNGVRLWLYKISSSINNSEESRCYNAMQWQTQISLICTAYNMATQKYAPVYIKLVHLTGMYNYSRWLPPDNVNSTLQIPISLQNYYSYRTVMIYTYQKGTEKGLASFSIYEDDELIAEWMKYYPSPEPNYIVDIIQDFEKEQIFIVKHIPSQNCQVTRIDSTSGKIVGQVQLNQGTADLDSKGSTLAVMNIVVPFLENSSPQKIHIYIIDKVELTTVQSAKITFTNSMLLRSIAVSSDSQSNIYLSGGGNQLFFAKFNSDFTTYTYRIFEGGMNGSLSINQILSEKDILYYVFLGKYITTEKASTIIFKDDSLTYNCFAPRILDNSDLTWYPNLEVLNTPTVNITNFLKEEVLFLAPVIGGNSSRFDLNLNFPKTNIRVSTFSYTGNKIDLYDLSDGTFYNQYKQQPYQDQKCSMVAGQAKLVNMTSRRISVSSQAYIQFYTAGQINCQGRLLETQVMDPETNTNYFRIPYIYYDNVTQYLRMSGPFFTFFIRVRYIDQYKGLKGGYQDSYIFQQVISLDYYSNKISYDLATPDYCTQTPFPYLFGGKFIGDEFKTLAMFTNALDGKILLGGSANTYLNPVFFNYDQRDAFIMKISPTGYVYWVTQLFSLRTQYDQVSAITFTNQSVYAFYSTSQIADPSSIVSCLVKMRYQDGQTYWMKNFQISSLFPNGRIYIKEGNDLSLDSKPKSFKFVLSFMGYWNDQNAQYPGNIFFQDSTIDQGPSSQYAQLFYPAALPASKTYHGQSLFDFETDYVYVTQQGYFTSNIVEDLIVLKQQTITGSIQWSRIYNMDSPSMTGITRSYPVIAQNNKTKDIYVAQAGGYSHLVKIKNDGMTLKRVYAKTSTSNTVKSINILIDTKRDQITVVCLTELTGSIEIMTLDSNFNVVSNLYKEYTNIISAGLVFTTLVDDYYYITFNILDFGNTFHESNTLISKKSVNAEEHGRHQCLTMEESLNQYSLLYTFPINDASMPLYVLMTVTQPLVVNDAYLMIAIQAESIKSNKLLPRPFPLDQNLVKTSDSSIQLSCKFYSSGQGPPANYLPVFYISYQDTKIFSVQENSYRNCFSYNIKYKQDLDTFNQASTSIMPKYHTIQANSITVISQGFAFYRNLQINQPCLYTNSTICEPYAIWPIIVNLYTNEKINQTAPVATCQGSYNYPKILFYSSESIKNIAITLRGSDVHQPTGNYLMCGQINKNINNDFKDNQNVGYIQLADLNGKIQWSLTHTSVQSGIDSQYIDCYFGNSFPNYVFSFYHQSNDVLGIINQNYDTGDMYYMKKITGLYSYSLTSQTKVFFDSQQNSAYVTGTRMDQTTEQWTNFILRIDLSNINMAVQRYWSYLQYSGAVQQNDQIFHIDFSKVNDFMYSLSIVTLSSQNIIQLTQYKRTNGQYIRSRHQQYDSSLKKLHVDSNGQLYQTMGFVDGSNTYFKRTLLQYDQNLGLVQGMDLKILLSYKQGIYESDLTSDSTFLYEFFHFQGKYFFITKVLKANLSTIKFQMSLNSDTTASTFAKIYLWSDKLFIFFQSNNFQSSFIPFESIVNLLDQDFTHDISCIQYIDQAIDQQSYSTQLNDLSSGIAQNFFQGDFRLMGLTRTYMEKIIGIFTYIKFYQANLQGCPNIPNTFNPPRTTQWVIPTSLPYTIALPLKALENCVGAKISGKNNLDDFTISPTGLKRFLGGQFEFKIQYTYDYGTYLFYEFYNGTDFFISESRTIVEIYPSQEYGVSLVRQTCPTSVYPAIYGLNNYLALHMDYDSTQDNLLICGQTSSIFTILSQTGGFLSLYSTSFQLIYHLYIQLSINSNVQTKYCAFGNDNNIYSVVYKQKSTLTVGDNEYKTFLFKHTSKGKFLAGKQFMLQDYLMHTTEIHQLDTSTSDIYLMGKIIKQVSASIQSSSGYLVKIDQNFNVLKYILIKDHDDTQSLQFHALAIDSSNQQAYITISGQRVTPYPYLISFSKISFLDGAKQWSKYFKHTQSSWEIQRRSTDKSYQKFSLALIQDRLYSCIVVQSSSTQEIFLGKHYPSDGTIDSKTELQLVGLTNNACNLHYHESSDTILMAYGKLGTMYVMGFSPSSFTFNTKQIRFSNTTADYDYAIFSSTSSIAYMLIVSPTNQVISRMSDFSNFVLQETCQVSSVSTSWQSAHLMPNGYRDSMSQYYINNPDFISSLEQVQDWSQYFTDPTKFRIYTNLTFGNVQPRILIGNCYSAAAPVIPIIPSRTGQRVSDSLGGFVVGINASITVGIITQCSNMKLNITFISTPTAGSWCFNYNSTSSIITVIPTNNSCAGSFNLQIKAIVIEQTSVSTLSNVFQFDVERNYPPTIIMNFTTTVTMFAHHNYTWNVFVDEDKEGDEPVATVSILDTNLNPVTFAKQWFTFTKIGKKQIKVNAIDAPQPPNGLNSITYKIKLSVSDSFNLNNPNVYYIDLTIIRNYPPVQITPIQLIIPAIKVPKSFAHTFWYDNFQDQEGDLFNISCVASTTNALNANWIKIDYNKTVLGNITIYGKCPSIITYAGNYKITCKIQDLDPIAFLSIEFTLIVLKKDPVQILNPQIDQKYLIPESGVIIYNLYDDSGVVIQSTMYVNGTIYNPVLLAGWIDWYPLVPKIIVSPTINSQQGNHSVWLKIEDKILDPIWNNFTIEIQENLPPYAIKQLKNMNKIANNRFQIDFNLNELFTDPENLQMTGNLATAGGGNLPYFFTSKFSNGTVIGFTTSDDVGIYALECVVFDNAKQSARIPFFFQVIECQENYFFSNNECLEQCTSGSYGDVPSRTCIKCPIQCRSCFGSDPSQQCSECNNGFFKLNDGCFEKCPDGYFGDKTDRKCKSKQKIVYVTNIECHKACSTCYGSLSTQCFTCNELIQMNEFDQLARQGYVLQSGSECKIPQCLLGQYFYWYPEMVGNQYIGYCKNCHETCLTCIGESSNECILCQPAHFYNSQSHTCTKCEDVAGMYTNEENECEEICGDGIILNKQCDDGNTITGDGCSNECLMEYGFECLTANSICRETIPPTMKVVMVSSTNLVYLEFSEYVFIEEEKDLAKDNFQIQLNSVDGGISTNFDYRIVEDPDQSLIPNRKINKLMIKLQEIKQSILGSESLLISIKDISKIKDGSGNQLLDIEQVTNPAPYTYLSATERMVSNSGGQTIKYTFLSVCSFNLILKVIMNSTMQFIWGLVHSLQVFTLLLYINIEFPENVIIFSNYMQVASGDVDEFKGFIPNISEYLIDKDQIYEKDDDRLLYYKFKADEISPYFIIAYGQKLTLWAIGLLAILPGALLLNKLCKNIKIWEEMVSQFFFNGPLRAFIEMYLELIVQIVLNSKFLKVRNISMILTSGLAFVVGSFALVLPFLLMTIVYHNRRVVNKETWLNKFGMLTYEVNNKEVLQMYYYPLFIYQRLIIAVVIVYGTQYTILQCLIVIFCNLAMIIYLVSQRPFKEESQQTTIVLDEIAVTICVIIFMVIEIKQIKGDQLKNIGFVILLFIVISVSKNFAMVIYFGMQQAQVKIKQMLHAEDQQIDSIDSSLDSSDEEDHDKIRDSEQISTTMMMQEILKDDQAKYHYQQQITSQKATTLRRKRFNLSEIITDRALMNLDQPQRIDFNK